VCSGVFGWVCAFVSGPGCRLMVAVQALAG